MFVSAESGAPLCRSSLGSRKPLRQPRRKTLFHNGADTGTNRARDRNTNDDCATHSLPRNQSKGSRHNRPINRVFVGRKESLACTRVTQNLYTQKKKIQFRQASTTQKRLRTKIAHSMSRYGSNDNVSNAAIVSVSKTFPIRHWQIQQF